MKQLYCSHCMKPCHYEKCERCGNYFKKTHYKNICGHARSKSIITDKIEEVDCDDCLTIYGKGGLDERINNSTNI